MRFAGAVSAACFCFGVVTPALAETVAVVTASPESDRAAEYLMTQIDVPAVRRSSHHARALEALLAEAREGWPEELVVVVDTERAVVSVVRPGDGTMGSRALGPSAASAPYAAALAAVELLEIVRAAPPAKAAPLSDPHPAPAGARIAFVLGVVQNVSLDGDVGLVRPSVGIDLELTHPPDPMFLAVGLHATGLVPMRRAQVLILPSGPDDKGTIEYRRDEGSLRFLVGHRQAPSAAVGWCDIGLAQVRATALDGVSNVVAYDRRTTFWVGLGGELRYTLVDGLALGIGAGVAWLPVASRFYASPPGATTRVPAFDEGSAEFRATAAVVWESAL